MGGAESARTFFKHPFLLEKEVSWLKKIKNCFCFFSDSWWSRRYGLDQPPSLKQHPEARSIRLGLIYFYWNVSFIKQDTQLGQLWKNLLNNRKKLILSTVKFDLPTQEDFEISICKQRELYRCQTCSMKMMTPMIRILLVMLANSGFNKHRHGIFESFDQLSGWVNIFEYFNQFNPNPIQGYLSLFNVIHFILRLYWLAILWLVKIFLSFSCSSSSFQDNWLLVVHKKIDYSNSRRNLVII